MVTLVPLMVIKETSQSQTAPAHHLVHNRPLLTVLDFTTFDYEDQIRKTDSVPRCKSLEIDLTLR